MVASSAPDIFQKCPDCFLGLQWWKPTPGALPKVAWVKPCNQGSSVATCSPLGWTRIRFYPALNWLCNIHRAILDGTACHHQLWSTAYCPIPSTCCRSCLHEVGLSAIPWAQVCPCASCCSPGSLDAGSTGKGRDVSSAGADRAPWAPKRKAGVGDRGEAILNT